MRRCGKRMAAVMLAGCLIFAAGAVTGPAAAYAKEGTKAGENDGWADYGQTIYNTTNGLVSNKVTSVAQTDDGMVWIGTDKGLTAFDGNEFVDYGGFYHFDGVNDMVRTRSGGIWFATTTYGGAIYLGNRFQHFDDVGEEISNYATTITEASDGSIYIGTLTNMLAINPNEGYTRTMLVGEEYFFVNSLTAGMDGCVGGTTINGDVFFLKDGQELARFDGLFTGQACILYGCGSYLVGTPDGRIMVFDAENPDSGVVKTVEVPIAAGAGTSVKINNLYLEDNERLWVLSEGGIGYYMLDNTTGEPIKLSQDRFAQCSFDNFESGFTDMMMDYQGNYWIASSKRGVLLLGKSDFTDELSQLGIDTDTINSVIVRDDILYVGTDSGLIMISRKDNKVLEAAPAGNLAGKRLTDIVFFDGKLTAAVYGEGVYVENELILTDYVRINRLQEENGFLYILADEGCAVWDGNDVVKYDSKDGLYNTKVNCALFGTFGRQSEERLYIGSEGAGIYVLLDGVLEKCLDENYGLPSKNINDMTVYDAGFFIATDRGIAYYNGKKIVELKRLPEELADKECGNLFIWDGKLDVICRDAVYRIDLEDLFYGDDTTEPEYSLYDDNAGFFGTVTDKGHGFMDEAGRIYLPCTGKIYSIGHDTADADISSYKLLLQSVKGDERSAEIIRLSDKAYEVNLTKDIETIDIFCSLLNFSNDDPYVRYILHGVDSDYTTIRSSGLEHIIYEELPGGSYTFWFELVDKEGETADRIELTINKEKSLFEKLWVRMLLLGAAFAVLMYYVFKDRRKYLLTNSEKDVYSIK